MSPLKLTKYLLLFESMLITCISCKLVNPLSIAWENDYSTDNYRLRGFVLILRVITFPDLCTTKTFDGLFDEISYIFKIYMIGLT